MSEVYDRYVDTAGNYHYSDVETGHHVIRKSCGYYHEDRDGYIIPLEKNCHAYRDRNEEMSKIAEMEMAYGEYLND